MTDGAGRRRQRGGKPVRRRRVWALIVVVVVLVVFGGVVALSQLLANKERVTSMWVGAEIRADGSARVTEVIDYDFGHSGDSHGIYRDVPGSPFEDGDHVRVTMDGHKVPYEDTYGDYYQDEKGERDLADRLKIGDPGHLVSGVHRYRIQYVLPEVVKGHRLAWDAVGTGWKVDRANVEVHVVGARGFGALRCERGTWDDGRPCTAVQSEPGHLVVRVGRLSGKEGLTLYATAAKTEAAGPAALPAAPSGRAVGTTLPHPMRNGGLFLAVALTCAALTVCALRHAGRDRVTEDGGRVRRVEAERLARTLTPSAAPPDDLTPAQGGILLTERADKHHQVAWLLTAAADGLIAVRGGDRHPVIDRRDSGEPGDQETEEVLDKIFSGRSSLALGTRDHWFRQGWNDLLYRLDRWRATSDLWDAAGRRRAGAALTGGLIGTLLGLVLAITGGVLSGRRVAAGWPVLLTAAVLAGVGAALVGRHWELERRTPLGTARWLQVEAFRRYLADPATCPDELPTGQRADRYAAWAVALGVESAWEAAVGASTSTRRASTLSGSDVLLAAVVLSSAPPPAPSGSSGGGGGGSTSGGVGGGAGGGGGGSW
ncbi:DUF2207 domain-containing protein [Streptomyces sp. NPDC005727]|uniref:DUF2207 family protein n=1 Tax=Streptomyces sp. NPDC005727 TaxID=3157053 RepID=UPI0033D85BBB